MKEAPHVTGRGTAIIRKAAPLAAALLLSGCISFSAKPPPQLISLTPAMRAPAGDLAPGSTEPPLVVVNPDSVHELDQVRVPVQVNGSGVAFLKGAIWSDRPARQLRIVIAETIRAKDNRVVYEDIGSATAGRPVLTGRLEAMGYDAASGSVVIRLDAQLATPGGTPKLRRFEATVPGIAPEATAVGPALNRAANDLAAQVAAWVG